MVLGRLNLRPWSMTEVTAEMIERGRGADPMVAADRRRRAREVRDAREKLTSSSGTHRAFDLELLRLYAERRQASLPWLALLGAAFVLVLHAWRTTPAPLVWVALDAFSILCGCVLAQRFLRRPAATINVVRWERLFVIAESVQGGLWSMVVVFACDARLATFSLVALLLIAAINATVTASIPAAVYGALLPVTVAVIAVMRPARLTGPDALLAVLALGTLVYFVVLARNLRVAALQSLSLQAEKDDLIAELERSKANSDLARHRAEESNLAKSRFLATMSHELRTPLNAILGFSEVMKTELFGSHLVPAYKEYSQDIHSSGEHLLMLINEILDLSRVEAGRYELREEPVDLAAVLEECRHLLALRAKKKGILIQENLGPALPRLWADARALRQVALNLLSNAIKFTPQGGSVCLSLGCTDDGRQFFSVADTGPGIPDSEIPVIMSSFGRGSFAQKTAEEGSGLGLPIVKGLVELHGGSFALFSRIREGTTVTVHFPPERVMSVLPPLAIETATFRDAA